MYDLSNRSALNIASTDWNFDSDGDPNTVVPMLIEEMKTHKGIGLAANQVGLEKRIFVMGSDDIPGFPQSLVAINPKIFSATEETVLGQEGCLSFPDVWLQIKRPKSVIVKYQNVKGDLVTEELTGLASRCFQHEYDHLDGVCFIDKVSRMKLELALKKSRKKSR
jgi:peptide deformylase